MSLSLQFIITIIIISNCSCCETQNEKGNDIMQPENPAFEIKDEKLIQQNNFMSFWKSFTQLIENKNFQNFRKVSLDTVRCNELNVDFNTFWKSRYNMVFDSLLTKRLAVSDAISFVDSNMDSGYFSDYHIKLFKNNKLTIKEVNVERKDTYPDIEMVTLLFIETINGYKFFGYQITPMPLEH